MDEDRPYRHYMTNKLTTKHTEKLIINICEFLFLMQNKTNTNYVGKQVDLNFLPLLCTTLFVKKNVTLEILNNQYTSYTNVPYQQT